MPTSTNVILEYFTTCTRTCNRYIPNVVVEWLMLLLRILYVSGSNLGPKTRYPNDLFPGFPQYVQENVWILS
jgi:hypothetical protein